MKIENNRQLVVLKLYKYLINTASKRTEDMKIPTLASNTKQVTREEIVYCICNAIVYDKQKSLDNDELKQLETEITKAYKPETDNMLEVKKVLGECLQDLSIFALQINEKFTNNYNALYATSELLNLTVPVVDLNPEKMLYSNVNEILTYIEQLENDYKEEQINNVVCEIEKA